VRSEKRKRKKKTDHDKKMGFPKAGEATKRGKEREKKNRSHGGGGERSDFEEKKTPEGEDLKEGNDLLQ